MSEKPPQTSPSTPTPAPSKPVPPKSAPPKPVPPKPVPPKSKPAKKGGIGCFSYLLIVSILLSGSVYFAYQQPLLRPYLEKYWDQLRTNITSRIPYGSDTPAVESRKPVTVTIAKKTPAEKKPVEKKPAEKPKPKPKPEPTVRPADNVQSSAQFKELKDDIARLQIAQSETSRRVGLLSSDNDDARDFTGLEVSLIDLRLRHSGDTAAAAADLAKLSSVPGISPQWLAREIARLQNAASRGQIASVLEKLLRLYPSHESPPPESVKLDGVAGTLAGWFNVRRVDEVGGGENIREILLRMELLFLTGQRETYLHELESLAARPPVSDPNVALHLQTLQKFGAPEYFLTVEDKP